MSNQLLPGQKHFVNQVDETGLGAVDAVADESAPSSCVVAPSFGWRW